MAKRYTDTDIYNREWYHELEVKHKAFWDYICRTCNHVGIWNVNMRLASFLINCDYTKEEVLAVFGNRIIILEEDKWFLPKFIKFQYGENLNPNNNVHKSVISLIEKYELDSILNNPDPEQTLGRPLADAGQTLGRSSADAKDIYKDKDIVKDKDKLKEKVIKRKKPFSIPNMEEVITYFKDKSYNDAELEGQKFWNFYESKGWKVGRNPMKDWHKSAANWNLSNKPQTNRKAFIQGSHKAGVVEW